MIGVRRVPRLVVLLLVVVAALVAAPSPFPVSASAVRQAQAGAPVPVGRTPTTILASRLSLSGLGYQGVVSIATATGPVRALRFTLSGLRLDDPTLSVPGAATALRITGEVGRVTTAAGRRSTIYLRQLKGKLKLGPLPIPVDFTPENPPPLSFPWLVFDDVTIGLWLLDGGDLTVPNSRLSAGLPHLPLPAPTDTPAPPVDERDPGARSEGERAEKPPSAPGAARSGDADRRAPATTGEPTGAEPAPAANPYTADEVCGPGYRVVDEHRLGAPATVYLLRDADRNHCVVTLKHSELGTATPVASMVEPQGAQRRTDAGSYAYYAGPVRVAAGARCVRWGGSAGSARYESPFEHCP